MEPDQYSPRLRNRIKIQSNIMFPSMPVSTKWFFPSGLPTRTPQRTHLSPSTCQFSVHLIIRDVVTRILRIWLGVQINSVFIVPFLPASCYLVLPTPKYLFHALGKMQNVLTVMQMMPFNTVI